MPKVSRSEAAEPLVGTASEAGPIPVGDDGNSMVFPPQKGGQAKGGFELRKVRLAGSM